LGFSVMAVWCATATAKTNRNGRKRVLSLFEDSNKKNYEQNKDVEILQH